MLNTAKERELRGIVFFSTKWYSSMGNLKQVRRLKWHFLTRLKSNRLVKEEESDYLTVLRMNIPDEVCVVHLMGYGQIKLFKVQHVEKELEFLASEMRSMNPERRAELIRISWKIEEFYRGFKQFYGIERCQARKSQSQFCHFLLSIRSLMLFERARLTKGPIWYESKMRIHLASIAQFIENPSLF